MIAGEGAGAGWGPSRLTCYIRLHSLADDLSHRPTLAQHLQLEQNLEFGVEVERRALHMVMLTYSHRGCRDGLVEAPILEGFLEEAHMNRDELDGKTKQVKGKVKQSVGDLTDDAQLHDEGAADQAEGEVQEGFGRARRKVGQAIKDIGETIKR